MSKFAGKFASATFKSRNVPATVVVEQGSPWRKSVVEPQKGKFVTGVAAKKMPDAYTGDKVVGIATMHKSCLQPVFSQQEAEDSAKMRRS